MWLLAYRLVAFFVLLIMLSFNGAADGGTIFSYYTQWTFTLITIYFVLGSLISMYGCYKHHKKVGGDRIANMELEGDAEQGTLHSSEPLNFIKVGTSTKDFSCTVQDRELAGLWGYVFQVIFKMNAGAVVLTDCILVHHCTISYPQRLPSELFITRISEIWRIIALKVKIL